MALKLRFAATESLLLAGLLLLSAFSLLDSVAADWLSDPSRPDPITRLLPERFFMELLPAVSLCIALYWGIHLLGLSRTAFWLMALLVLLPQSMAILGHNQIEWQQFFAFNLGAGDDRSFLRDTGLFLASLVGLVALYRAIGIRQLDHRMLLQGIESVDRDRAALFEGLMLLGLVAAALLLTFLMIALSALLGRFDGLLERSSWSVVTIGGGATILLAISIALWFRGRQG